MISVVIATLNDEAVLGRALSPLVPAAVSGFVREVIVADAGSSDATLEIAEDAGCTILAGGEAAAVRTAHSDWVMTLKPCVQLTTQWEDLARHHLELRPDEPAFIPLIGGAGVGAMAARLLGRPGAHDVLLMRRDRYGRSAVSMRRLAASALLIV
jgi:glycosyltransferase involved in cell wall biosynthesis